MEDTKTVRFLIISDTHDMILSSDTSSALRTPSPEVDVVLHCGDLTEACTLDGLRGAVALLSAIPAELRLVIAGNHDTLLDPSTCSPEEHEEALRIMRDASITYLTEGTHGFALQSGATFSVFASPYTPSQHNCASLGHAFQYPSNHDRYNPKQDSSGKDKTPSYAINTSTPTSNIPSNVDIVMTHGPPKYLLDSFASGGSAGCEHLRRAICRVRPLLHCFGHVHSAYGMQRVLWRDAYNTSELEHLGIDTENSYTDDNILPLPVQAEGRMRNSNRKRGFAKLNRNTYQSLSQGKQTLMVNAAIMDEEGLPSNAPWVVELDLSCDKGARGDHWEEAVEVGIEQPTGKRKREDDEEASANWGTRIRRLESSNVREEVG